MRLTSYVLRRVNLIASLCYCSIKDKINNELLNYGHKYLSIINFCSLQILQILICYIFENLRLIANQTKYFLFYRRALSNITQSRVYLESVLNVLKNDGTRRSEVVIHAVNEMKGLILEGEVIRK